MKIRCSCGELIVDQTDDLAHKAHIIGDKDYFDFLDTVDDAIEQLSGNKQDLCMKIRRAEPSRPAWECSFCGRLYLNDKNGNLVEYIPQNGQANGIFDRDKPS